MHQHIQPALLVEERPRRGANGREIRQVQHHGPQDAPARRRRSAERRDGGVDLGGGARGNVDGGVLGVEHLGELVADADGGAGDDAYLGAC